MEYTLKYKLRVKLHSCFQWRVISQITLSQSIYIQKANYWSVLQIEDFFQKYTSKILATNYLLPKKSLANAKLIMSKKCFFPTFMQSYAKQVISTLQNAIFRTKHLWKFKKFSGTLPPASESKVVTKVNAKEHKLSFRPHCTLLKSSHLCSS